MTDFYDLRAELYDLAFDWDVDAEVEWLIARLGSGCRSLLEPGCGSGRMFPAFIRRGVTVTGLDLSKTMLERARQRLPKVRLTLHHADMSDFDLRETFDGAIIPINTFGYLLTDAQAKNHLHAVARHLKPGAKYLLQVDLRELDRPADGSGAWEMEKDGVRLKTTWGGRGYDPASRVETQVSRFEVLSGPNRGLAFEDDHPIRLWDWKSWTALLARTPFEQTAAYDGNAKGRPEIALGQELNRARLTWHELVLRA
ncbi:MAG: class I SAM-dependent methyltransferase [Elusimicrobiota bacterium]